MIILSPIVHTKLMKLPHSSVCVCSYLHYHKIPMYKYAYACVCLIVCIGAYVRNYAIFGMGLGNCIEQSRRPLREDSAQWGCFSLFNKTMTENSQNHFVLMTSHWLKQGGKTFIGGQGKYGHVKLHQDSFVVWLLSFPLRVCRRLTGDGSYHLGSISSVFDCAHLGSLLQHTQSDYDVHSGQAVFFLLLLSFFACCDLFLQFFHDRETKKPHKWPNITEIHHQIVFPNASPNWFKPIAINHCNKEFLTTIKSWRQSWQCELVFQFGPNKRFNNSSVWLINLY